VSSASLILTDRGLAFSEPNAIGAQGSTKVLAASRMGCCLVFVSSAIVTVALAAIGRDMHLSPAGGAVAALGCTLASSRSGGVLLGGHLSQRLLLALGMSQAIAALTTLVRTSIESDRAGTASGFNSAVPRTGSLLAIALLDGVLQQGGPQLFSGFHMAMLPLRSSAFLPRLRCSLSSLGPVELIPRD